MAFPKEHVTIALLDQAAQATDPRVKARLRTTGLRLYSEAADRHLITTGQLQMQLAPQLAPFIDGAMHELEMPRAEEQYKVTETIKIDKATADAFRNSIIGIPAIEESIPRLQEQAREHFPQALLDELLYFSQSVTAYGALHIEGLHVDGVADTTALALTTMIGTAYAEANEGGELVQKVQPDPSKADGQSKGSYRKILEIHVENAGQIIVPDTVNLVCAANEEQAGTLIVNSMQVINELRKRELFDEEILLRSGRFSVRQPESFAGDQDWSPGHSVLSGNVILPTINADFADVRPTNPEDTEVQRAYDTLKDICEDLSEIIVLKKGDALLIRNSAKKLLTHFSQPVQNLHGRVSFEPHPTNPRTFYRCYGLNRES